MNSTIYTTQPGTIPHRAIAHLNTLGPDVKLSTAELAEAIGAHALSLTPCMRPARDAGLVFTSYKPDNKQILFWSLGEDKTPAPPISRLEQRVETATTVRQKPGPKSKPRSPAPASPPANRHFRAGLFTDGTLEIEIGNEEFSLTREEAIILSELQRGGV